MVKNKYKVKITPKAYDDLDEIYDYISNKLFNTDAAEKLMYEIERSILRLRDFSLSCNYVRDEVLKRKGYRKLIVENYIVFYIVDQEEKQVVIIRVFYGRQKYEDLV